MHHFLTHDITLRYYLTANSCYHKGYDQYNWPKQWNINPTSSGPCGVVSPDGSGVPEQVCAEGHLALMSCTHILIPHTSSNALSTFSFGIVQRFKYSRDLTDLLGVMHIN